MTKQYQVKVTAKKVDLTNPAALETLESNWSTVDILVNNFGAMPSGTLDSLSDDVAAQAINLKMHAWIVLSRRCSREMSARNAGVVLNIIGTGGERPWAKYVLGSMEKSVAHCNDPLSGFRWDRA